MFELNKMLTTQYLLSLLPFLFFYLINKIFYPKTANLPKTACYTNVYKPYPLIGHFFAFYHLKKDDIFHWFANNTLSSPSTTFVVHRPFGEQIVMTANPATVKHILKNKFPIYEKGSIYTTTLKDLLGEGIFNVDGETWKFQRQVSVHEFTTKSLRRFVESVVDFEVSHRLIPILADAAKNQTVLDFQDILQRFTFDNICKIAFGYDPEYLSPSLPKAKFALAFEDAVVLSSQRFRTFPFLWKIRRFFNIGSEKRLKQATSEVREFANHLLRQRKESMSKTTSVETDDLLSRFLKFGQLPDEYVVDVVISFILAGRDTSAASLTWFFWLLHNNKAAEDEIVREVSKIDEKANENEHLYSAYDEVKEMVYTHAALSESMRLYPPVPVDSKQAAEDDVLPDGTHVKKGMRVAYLPYVMGRLETIWGPDWAEYRPERWLTKEGEDDARESQWKYVPQDPYSYPVFQAGPRICIGRELAFLQMKRVVAGVLANFKVVPVLGEGVEPVYLANLTAKMQGGLPVRIEERMQ